LAPATTAPPPGSVSRPPARRRTALQAGRDHNTAILWSLTEAWLRSFGRVEAAVSPTTIRSYRTGVHALLDAWTKEDVLHPGPEAATLYLRQLERRGLAASTIRARLAAARGLSAALRWCRAIVADPFADCHASCDTTPAWDKRMPYGDDEVAALVQVTGPADRVLVLLGAHAGLRAQECADLRRGEVHLARSDLLVRHGKGGKQRLVALSASLRQLFATLPRRADGFVLG
jgi:site-specific recombinase XerC